MKVGREYSSSLLPCQSSIRRGLGTSAYSTGDGVQDGCGQKVLVFEDNNNDDNDGDDDEGRDDDGKRQQRYHHQQQEQEHNPVIATTGAVVRSPAWEGFSATDYSQEIKTV